MGYRGEGDAQCDIACPLFRYCQPLTSSCGYCHNGFDPYRGDGDPMIRKNAGRKVLGERATTTIKPPPRHSHSRPICSILPGNQTDKERSM